MSVETERLPLASAWYSILGVAVSVISDIPEVVQRVDESYVAFRCPAAASGAAITLRLQQLASDAGYLVSDSRRYERVWQRLGDAELDLFAQLVQGVLERLHDRGIYVVHAGAAVYRDGAVLLAGRSGHGKTTLTLGLLRRGLGLLSDELAVIDPSTHWVVPYRRSLHIRPGTPELIPELGFLYDRPQHHLGGGIEWALAPWELEQALPGCLATPAPPRYILLLDNAPRPDAPPALTPVPAALATLELLRSTWGASVDFAGGLSHVARAINGARCARLQVGAFEPTLDCVMRWLETNSA